MVVLPPTRLRGLAITRERVFPIRRFFLKNGHRILRMATDTSIRGFLESLKRQLDISWIARNFRLIMLAMHESI